MAAQTINLIDRVVILRTFDGRLILGAASEGLSKASMRRHNAVSCFFHLLQILSVKGRRRDRS